MGARTTITRRLSWGDTDGAQVWHHSTLWRWVEDAEAELHREVGIIDRTFGFLPRVRLEATFTAPVVFDDEVEVTLEIGHVGRTSVRYDVTVTRDGAPVAEASLTAVLVADGAATPWPDDMAAALRGEP